MNLNRALVVTATAAGAMLLTMLLFGLNQQVSQQTFEWLMPVPQYGQGLLDIAGPMRVLLGLDNIFVVLYCSVNILLVCRLWQASTRIILSIMLVAGLAGGLLDFMENIHVFTLLHAAQLQLPISIDEIKGQMQASMLKWHLAYFTFFVLAYVFDAHTMLEKLFRWSLLYVQLPVGVFYYVLADTEWETLLLYWRYANMIGGFFMLAAVFHVREKSAPESAAVAAHAL